MGVADFTRPDGTRPIDGLPMVGDRVGGKYDIEREIGRGGMGAVYAARHAALGQLVAIKCLTAAALAAEGGIDRFLNEGRAAARIQSDHVARVMDVGMLESGVPYLVMELLEGSDLGAILDRGGALPVQTAVDYVLEAISAVAEAHSHGIIHRDLKPSNLFVARRTDGTKRIKVLDFGISKSVEAARPAITSTRATLGSPGYMSPEQIRSSRSVDARSDIWALGVTLYELLSGKPPFDGETQGELIAQILEVEPPSVSALRAEVPEELARIVQRCMARNREDRFADARALASALGAFASARGQRTLEATLRSSEPVLESTPPPYAPASMAMSELPTIAAHSETKNQLASVVSARTREGSDVSEDAAPRRWRRAIVLLAAMAAVALAVGAMSFTRSARRAATGDSAGAPSQVALPARALSSPTASTADPPASAPAAEAAGVTSPAVTPEVAEGRGTRPEPASSAEPRPRPKPVQQPRKRRAILDDRE